MYVYIYIYIYIYYYYYYYYIYIYIYLYSAHIIISRHITTSNTYPKRLNTPPNDNSPLPTVLHVNELRQQRPEPYPVRFPVGELPEEFPESVRVRDSSGSKHGAQRSRPLGVSG